ncbi:MAG: 5-formyltetrahydrofolate cyclo-ligase [Flavobacterium sp.]|uniref:5-formyltetrahydrofolate cyclo-ligase n=1 Tax=Flavobacterium sp. TaxID=239 RepID=UPI000C44D631|nr:5-formyltetrahydrofolate cyclo-ligase [Flavobacterium sp.]MBF04192.1 5-formyltetrahydrofolate cyclo-ligase [Flavobacterium sp.]|tara:strand:- start:189 stop:752 length:564 start_codon:yes stop_codon:yes gene_type:complete
MNKKELRIKYKALRQQFSENELEEKSLAIANQLLKLDIWQHTYYHLFLPIEEQKEVNTEYILQILAGKDKEVVLSKSHFETVSMTHYLLTDATKIKKNEYNIPEPVDGLEVPVNKIDVVFVPLLAYDKKGNRVGYGKGFYDRFLSSCKNEVIKIGVSFFAPEEKIEDHFENDISLNHCVTPTQSFSF